MIWLVCLAISCQTLIGALGLLYMRHFYLTERRRITEKLLDFVSAPDEHTPSPFAAYCDQMALLFSARVIGDIGRLFNQASGLRGRAAAKTNEETILAQLPDWAVLASQFLPKKLMVKLLQNPVMVGALSKMQRGNGSTQPEESTHRDE